MELRTGPFLERVLEPPTYYSWAKEDGSLNKPSANVLFREFFSRLNVFKDRKNWLPFVTWSATMALAGIFLYYICSPYFHWTYAFGALVYSMVCLGTHGTVFLHRYSTHHAYHFKNNFWLNLCRNLTIKIIPEEIYVISHHVHHSISDKPGDPYNPQGGWLYCFLADVNHQLINRNLNETDYRRLSALMKHTGVTVNTYAQYQRWGSLTHPLRLIAGIVFNWSVWYGVLFLIGGHELALAIFGVSCIWAFGVRTFNYEGHGKGSDRRREGIDFHWKDLSVNQMWPGLVAGEWHNNHHMYPNGARSGFLPHQIDLAWIFISSWHKIGAISSYRDFKAEFLEKTYLPHLEAKKSALARQKSLEVEPTAAVVALTR